MYMGLIGWLKKILRVKSITNQSITQSYNQTFSLEPTVMAPQELSEPSPTTIQLEKESLQLGVAAGYTGRFIRDIESSLSRMEAQMVTKDWFALKLDEAIKSHEKVIESRFQGIEATLSSLIRYFGSLPPETRLETLCETLKEMQLTNRMKYLINIVKDTKEVSYTELARRLNISEDALRGLLSRIVRRTNQIQRFERENKGWVRFISDSNQSLDQKSVTYTMQEGISDQ